MKKLMNLVLIASTFAFACGEESAPLKEVSVSQESVEAGANGIGIMVDSGFDLPEYGYAPDDLNIFIRSFEPSSCAMPGEYDLLGETEGFAWSIFLWLPAAEVYVGSTFEFGGNEGGTIIGAADSVGGQDGPSGRWAASGLHCDDPTYDLPGTGRIVALDESTITLQITDLCFVDYGPMDEFAADDTSDDVAYRADGLYVISRCDGTSLDAASAD